MTEVAHTPAQGALAALAAFSPLLVAVHVLKPEMEPSCVPADADPDDAGERDPRRLGALRPDGERRARRGSRAARHARSGQSPGGCPRARSAGPRVVTAALAAAAGLALVATALFD